MCHIRAQRPQLLLGFTFVLTLMLFIATNDSKRILAWQESDKDNQGHRRVHWQKVKPKLGVSTKITDGRAWSPKRKSKQAHWNQSAEAVACLLKATNISHYIYTLWWSTAPHSSVTYILCNSNICRRRMCVDAQTENLNLEQTRERRIWSWFCIW